MLPPADLLVVAFRSSQIVCFSPIFTRGLKHAAEECGPENCHTATAQLTLMDEKAIKIPDHFLILCSLLKKTEETKRREQEWENLLCCILSRLLHTLIICLYRRQTILKIFICHIGLAKQGWTCRQELDLHKNSSSPFRASFIKKMLPTD